jgi:hypothetical protein
MAADDHRNLRGNISHATVPPARRVAAAHDALEGGSAQPTRVQVAAAACVIPADLAQAGRSSYRVS